MVKVSTHTVEQQFCRENERGFELSYACLFSPLRAGPRMRKATFDAYCTRSAIFPDADTAPSTPRQVSPISNPLPYPKFPSNPAFPVDAISSPTSWSRLFLLALQRLHLLLERRQILAQTFHGLLKSLYNRGRWLADGVCSSHRRRPAKVKTRKVLPATLVLWHPR